MSLWDKLMGKPQAAKPPAKAPAKAEPTAPKLRVISGGGEEKAPFDQLIELTGLVVPPVSPMTDDEVAADHELVMKVTEHFAKNRPAPSSLPAVSLKVINVVAEPEVSLADLSKLIATDPALTAGVLKVANSSAYIGVEEVQSLKEAVTRLGLGEVSRIAGTVAARTLFQAQVKSEFQRFNARFAECFEESAVTARAAAWLAMKVRGTNSEQCFLAGMLHVLGRVVALRSLASVTMGSPGLDPAHPRVNRVLQHVEADFGGEVHQEWSLPRFSTLVAVRMHDLGLPTDGEYLDVHVVRLAAAMVQLRRQAWRLEQLREEVNESAAALKLDAFVLRAFETQIKDEYASVRRGPAPKRAANGR